MVLQAAETIVVEDGFAALKVRAIAMEIGYTVGSIYMVFDNMADLIMHLKGRVLDAIADQLTYNVSRDSAKENIEQLANAYLNYASQNFNQWSMVFEHRLAANEQVPDWYQQKVDHVFSLVEAQFKALPSTHTEEQNCIAARALWSGVHGVCILSLTGKLDLVGINNLENTVGILVDNFIKGWQQNL